MRTLLAIQLEHTMDYTAGIDHAIEAVTLDESIAAFRKYLDPSKLGEAYAGDIAKK